MLFHVVSFVVSLVFTHQVTLPDNVETWPVYVPRAVPNGKGEAAVGFAEA